MQLAQMSRTKGRQEHPQGEKIPLSPEERARIKKLREDKGWSQGDLADKADTTQGTISNMESGATQPYLEVYQRVLVALKTDPSTKGLYNRIVVGAHGLDEHDQLAVATLIETLKARGQKE